MGTSIRCALLVATVLAGCGSANGPCGRWAIQGEPAQEICTQTVDDVELAEGDIALGPSEAQPGQPRTALRYRDSDVKYFAWPRGVVPYKISGTLPSPARVHEAIAHITAVTKIRFVKRTTQPDYVVFQPGSGCWSWVGRKRGPQDIKLSPGCTSGTIIHELGHALGLWHEHTRKDRDAYITVKWGNIVPGMESAFQQKLALTKDFGPYDYGSIMHYAYWAFSKNGLPTITKKDGSSAGFGQLDGLSAGDITAIHKIHAL